MDSDPSPRFASIYYYEYKWLVKNNKSDLQKSRKFGKTFKFIDYVNLNGISARLIHQEWSSQNRMNEITKQQFWTL